MGVFFTECGISYHDIYIMYIKADKTENFDQRYEHVLPLFLRRRILLGSKLL